MRLALAIASCIVLVVHGLVFYDQFFHRWERHQTAYFDQARARSTNDAERAELAARSPKIEQIIVTQFGETRVDRCPTCHMASDDPRFADYSQPLTTHPYSEAMGDHQRDGRWERRHRFADFGCTVCHDGQSRGLEAEYAHGEDHYWPEPLLGYVAQATWRRDLAPSLVGTAYLEANCAQCHTEENFAGTPNVAKGRQLFFVKNCYGCHRIDGLSDGTLGPDLTQVGKTWKLDYLWESIVDPRANLATSFMPKFALAPEDVRALVVFMKSRRGMNFTETTLDRYRAKLAPPAFEPPSAAAAPVDEVTKGGRILAERACTACHKLGATDGGIAPDLTYEGLIRPSAWIYDHFKNPRALVPDSIMPSFRFADEEFTAMTAFLSAQTAPPPPMSPAETFTALCARCHGVAGDGHGPSAVYLDPYPRDLTKAAFMNSKPRERFLASLRDGVPGTSMPPLGQVLTGDQRAAVLDHVFTAFVVEPARERRVRNIPDTNPVAMGDESMARGEAIYLKRCTGCHGSKADGKGPNSLDILPRPRNLRNAAFIAGVSDRRLLESLLYGVQGTAMPPWIDYGLTTTDAGDLVNYIRSLNTRR
ncbi:MAG: c-type cytochrome [Acidobacteriota bacterium]